MIVSMFNVWWRDASTPTTFSLRSQSVPQCLLIWSPEPTGVRSMPQLIFSITTSRRNPIPTTELSGKPSRIENRTDKSWNSSRPSGAGSSLPEPLPEPVGKCWSGYTRRCWSYRRVRTSRASHLHSPSDSRTRASTTNRPPSRERTGSG